MDPNDFPNIANAGLKVTSPVDASYNCFAWAAGDQSNWWEPGSKDAYWPVPSGFDLRLENFRAAFESLGYELCTGPEYDPAFEKVACYCAEGVDEFTHAAKQLGPGLWSSKLGEDEDVSHRLEGLEGGVYGTVKMFLHRRK